MKYKQEEGILEYSDNGASFSVACRIPYINEVAIAKENIGIAYFYSPYFQAASKYFSLKIPSGENREDYWGMLYPICLFDESNATIYDELKSFQKSMLLSAFLKFVEFTISIGKVNPRDGAEFHYSDFSASDSSYILIYDKSVFNDIDRVIVFLYNMGFYYVEDPFVQTSFYHSIYQRTFLDQLPKMLLIKFPSAVFQGFTYLDYMYKQLLPKVDSPFFRYLILYQIVEYLMEVKKNEIIYNNLNDFVSKPKNDIREELQNSLKDERLIEYLYTGIPHTTGIFRDFCDKAKTLFENVGKELPKVDNYIPYMYGVRNIIVHNFKTATNNENLVKELSEIFEKAIYELLLSVKVTNTDNKSLFVWDQSLSYKENKRLFYALYHGN